MYQTSEDIRATNYIVQISAITEQLVCQICAVSVNIARTPRIDEHPHRTSSINFGPSTPNRRKRGVPAISNSDEPNHGPVHDDCDDCFVAKGLWPTPPWPKIPNHPDGSDDDESDPDYSPTPNNEASSSGCDSDDDDDEMEEDGDGELNSDGDGSTRAGSTTPSDSSAATRAPSNSLDERDDYNYINTEAPSPAIAVMTGDFPDTNGWGYPQLPRSQRIWARWGNWACDHLAGPQCTDRDGYNGHVITAEEMRGCITMQSLVPKTPNWRPAPGEGLEPCDEGAFFLSGLFDFKPNGRGYGYKANVHPARHGRRDPWVHNLITDPQAARDVSMPFHPTCLEVFKRASLLRTGKIDIASLTDWFRLEATGVDFIQKFPRHVAVRRGHKRQWWHHTGDEWLAANPLFIPQLAPILKAATGDAINDDEMEIVHGEAKHDEDEFGEPSSERNVTGIGEASGGPPPYKAPARRTVSTRDSFKEVPPEIRLEILSYLATVDVVNMRLVSRTFHVLRQAVYRKTLLREAPWLWEAWSGVPYSHWVGPQNALQLSRQLWRIEETEKDLQDWWVPALVQESDPPGHNDELIRQLGESVARRISREKRKLSEPVPAPQLATDTTDWQKLCTNIATNWSSLRGLQNRRRIWRDCEYILDRIESLRAQGKMGDGIVVDPEITARRSVEEAYHKPSAFPATYDDEPWRG